MNRLLTKFVILILALSVFAPISSSIAVPDSTGDNSNDGRTATMDVNSASIVENCNWSFSSTNSNTYVYCSNEVAVVRDYQISNNRAKGTPAIKFSITIPRSSNIRSITPTSFTLNPGEKKVLTITVKIPDCKGARDYVSFDFPFDVTTDPSACSRSVKMTLQCRGECPCCSYQFEKGFQGSFPDSLKPGGKATTTVRISNKCETQSLTLNVVGNKNTTVSPKTSVTLKPGQSQLYAITFTMPSGIGVGGSCVDDSAEALYSVKASGCTDFVKKFQIKCDGSKDIKENCSWELVRRSASPPKLIYCSGETVVTTAYQIANNRPSGSTPVQFKITLPKSSNIVYVSPASFTLKPGEKKLLEIKVKMPEKGSVDGVKYEFPFSVATVPATCSKSVKITLYCKDCSPCCDWSLSSIAFPKQMCPNEEYKVYPKITNKCNKPVKFAVSVKDHLTVNSGKLAYVTVPANSTVSVSLRFIMPNCKGQNKSEPAYKAIIEYSIKPEFCNEKKYIHIVECKNCQ